MLSFTNSADTYDGADREARRNHDLWFTGYNTSVESSPVFRMKQVIGELFSLTSAGDDAWTTYGRVMSLVMHAALTGDGLDAVPFLLNSPKDTALARILEEAVLAVDENARDLTMPEWTKHCAELLASTSLSVRAKTTTLTFHSGTPCNGIVKGYTTNVVSRTGWIRWWAEVLLF